jgi:NAD(P)H dehydrogenase (quinone)
MLLVTGATGQLGRRVLAHLLNRIPAGRIAAGVRDPHRAATLAARGVTVRHADFDHPATVGQAFAGIERLLLISTSGPHGQRYRQHHNAILGAVSHIVYTSLTTGAPPSIARLHRQTEATIRESGIGHTFLRNPLYVENYTAALPAAIETGMLVSATGAGRVAAAARDDLALAAATALADTQHDGATFKLTGLDAWSFDELAALTTAVSQRPVTHRHVDAEELATHRRRAGVSAADTAVIVDIHLAIRAGTLATVTGDLAGLIRRPPTTLEQSVQQALATP